ncbi:MAG: hypothetical protein JO115_01295 [Pseudonocardiales bacterium]|nr:hypothetical protein [Pseudonocardiales bacterium]
MRESQSPDDKARDRPVMLDGLTVQPRAEMPRQAKWITWVVRATGMPAVGERAWGKGTLGKPARVGSADTPSAAA